MNRKHYIILDTETSTLPFADELSEGDAKKKTTIATTKPLVYDIGYTIADREGNIYEKKNFIISDVYDDPQLFNTGYYAFKREKYEALLASGESIKVSWEEAIKEVLKDAENAYAVGAYNAPFDFRKAIPFTDRFVNAKNKGYEFYSTWLADQKAFCRYLISDKYKEEKSKEKKDTQHFVFRGKTFETFDIWGMCCQALLNNNNYKKFCLENGYLAESGNYFSTKAEIAYRYLFKEHEFDEDHMALSDAIIETAIMAKVNAKQKFNMGIRYNPYSILGYVSDFITSFKKPNATYAKLVYDRMNEHYGFGSMSLDEIGTLSPSAKRQYNKMSDLALLF